MKFSKLIIMLVSTFLVCPFDAFGAKAPFEKSDKKANFRKAPSKKIPGAFKFSPTHKQKEDQAAKLRVAQVSRIKADQAARIKAAQAARGKATKVRELAAKKSPVCKAPAPVKQVNYGPNWKGDFRLANGIVVRRTATEIVLEKGNTSFQAGKGLHLSRGTSLNGYVLKNDIILNNKMTPAQFISILNKESKIIHKIIR